jgi:hypothetical protein
MHPGRDARASGRLDQPRFRICDLLHRAECGFGGDWLHDAPGVDETLLAHSRFCFGHWIDWYMQEGYNPDVPGSNYHAKYVLAKAFVAVGVGSEDAREATRLGGTSWTKCI